MCRSLALGGRRCPCSGSKSRQVEYALTSVSRLERRLATLEDNDATDEEFAVVADRYQAAVNRLVEREQARAATVSAYGPPQPSTAGDYTPESVETMSDEDYSSTHQLVWGQDPKSAYSLALADSGESLADRQEEAEWDTADEDDYPSAEPSEWDEIGALAGNLNRDEYAREEWDQYVMGAYLDAEEQTGGSLLNRRGRDAGIDVFSLFTGSAERASRYASDELKAYWQSKGRHTAASHRYMLLGRPSDKDAYEYATTQARFDDAPAVL